MSSGWLSNTWLVGDEPGGHAVLIDTGGPTEPILQAIEDHRLTVTHVLCTHHHIDHVQHNQDYVERFGCPVVTDVHEPAHCAPAGAVVDVLQIPAFLCRQTDLLVAAAKTGCAIKIKKGQFLAPWDMKNVLGKFTDSGNPNVLLTDRGTSFGYNTLVNDFRGLPTMAAMGAPVVFDATHSVQQPGGLGATSGGQREFVAVLARAAVAVGVAGVFIETHEDPDNTTSSDGPNMLPLEQMPALIDQLMALDRIAKGL